MCLVANDRLILLNYIQPNNLESQLASIPGIISWWRENFSEILCILSSWSRKKNTHSMRTHVKWIRRSICKWDDVSFRNCMTLLIIWMILIVFMRSALIHDFTCSNLAVKTYCNKQTQQQPKHKKKHIKTPYCWCVFDSQMIYLPSIFSSTVKYYRWNIKADVNRHYKHSLMCRYNKIHVASHLCSASSIRATIDI